jgi:outer membrane receptor protein involved in Fe transport
MSVAYGEQLLKPLTANQADLSFEYYYGNGNAITWPVSGRRSRTAPTRRTSAPVLQRRDADWRRRNCTSADGTTDYSFSRVLNDSETINIRGVELGVEQSFDQFLPIKGFGVTGNMTVVDPDAVTLGNGFHLRNLSKLTWNLTPYWENEHFSVRLSVNHRSAYEQDYADSFFAGYGDTHVVRPAPRSIWRWAIR